MSAFPFIEAERAEQHNVAKACELLEVSRSAYYEHAKHLPSARALADADLAERIEAIYDDSRGTYGCPRFHAGLRPEGVHASKDAAREIAAAAGAVATGVAVAARGQGGAPGRPGLPGISALGASEPDQWCLAWCRDA